MLKNNHNIIIKLDGETYFCPVEVTMDLIGGKWKAAILWYLQEGIWRYSDLRKKLVTISERILIRDLKSLEALGLIERRAYAEVPPRVEYRMTPYGQTLTPLLAAISQWGELHARRYGNYQEETTPGQERPD